MGRKKNEKSLQNLKPIKTLSNEEAKKRGSAGGKKSVEVRREKKLMSAIYADFLAKKHKIKLDDDTEKEIDGNELMEIVSRSILDRGDSASVSLMKEIREATEGSKITFDGEINTFKTPEERDAWYDAIAKRKEQEKTNDDA